MPAHDPAQDLELLTHAALEAGKIARTFFRADPKRWDKADGAGPVTEADLAVDQMLHETLRAARPDYGWLSEETEDDLDRLSAKRVFIVDPIDGTQAFIEGTSAFSHSLAVVEDGVPIAAAVFLPIQDKLYGAAFGQGASLNGAPIQASPTQDPALARILATKNTLTEQHWAGGLPPVKRSYRPSLAYRMSLIGEGRFEGMATFRDTWEWDIAAGALIVSEAGGVATDGRGLPLRFNNQAPHVPGVLVAGAALHPVLLKHRLG